MTNGEVLERRVHALDISITNFATTTITTATTTTTTTTTTKI